jgi:hypothetical protein
MLETWRQEGHGELLDRKLPTSRDRVVFCRLFRALIRDGIRLSPPADFPTTLLDALPEPPLAPDSFADAYATIRLKLRPHLRGNLPAVERVVLTPELREKLQVSMRNLDAEAHTRLLTDIRDLVPRGNERSRVLVVSDPTIRAWLQRFIEPLYPDVKVMTDTEVQEEAVAS